MKIHLEVVGHNESRKVEKFEHNGESDLAVGEERTHLFLRTASGKSFVVRVPGSLYAEVLAEIRNSGE